MNLGGVRIEDDVAITDTGIEVLTKVINKLYKHSCQDQLTKSKHVWQGKIGNRFLKELSSMKESNKDSTSQLLT